MQQGNTNDIGFDLGASIFAIFSIIKKRWKLFLLFYIILLGITFLYNFNKRKVYQTSFTITNAQISSVESKTIIESYGEIKRNSLNSAAEKNIKLLEVQYLDDNNLEGHTLKIKLSLFDTASFGVLMKDLMNYCNNNYLVEKVKNKNENTLRIKENYRKQLDELILYKQKAEKENINSGYFNYYNIYKDIAVFQESIARLEFELSQPKGFEVSILPVSVFKIQGLSLINSLILASIFGLIFCPFLVFYFDKINTSPKKE